MYPVDILVFILALKTCSETSHLLGDLGFTTGVTMVTNPIDPKPAPRPFWTLDVPPFVGYAQQFMGHNPKKEGHPGYPKPEALLAPSSKVPQSRTSLNALSNKGAETKPFFLNTQRRPSNCHFLNPKP